MVFGHWVSRLLRPRASIPIVFILRPARPEGRTECLGILSGSKEWCAVGVSVGAGNSRCGSSVCSPYGCDPQHSFIVEIAGRLNLASSHIGVNRLLHHSNSNLKIADYEQGYTISITVACLARWFMAALWGIPGRCMS